jgi:hypothetical protein
MLKGSPKIFRPWLLCKAGLRWQPKAISKSFTVHTYHVRPKQPTGPWECESWPRNIWWHPDVGVSFKLFRTPSTYTTKSLTFHYILEDIAGPKKGLQYWRGPGHPMTCINDGFTFQYELGRTCIMKTCFNHVETSCMSSEQWFFDFMDFVIDS